MKKFFLLTLLLLFTACTPQAKPTVEFTQPPQQPTRLPTLTSTPVPPTKTPLLPTDTPTLTSTPTITMTATSAALFDQIQILGGYYNQDNSIIYLSFPKVDKNYNFIIDQHVYECKVDVDYEDRVNCYGRFLDNQRSKSVLVQVFDPESSQILYENDVYVPMTIPTPVPEGEASTWCPLRGQNVTCETEWRTENGEICVVMSCYDACGYYYSEHTCKEPWQNNAIIQPTPTPF